MPSTVLIVEDDADIRDSVAEALRAEGVRVLATDEGQKALEMMETWRPAVVLLDLTLAGMNGPEFRMRQRQSAQLAAIPVVVMSGRPDPRLTVDATLRKPFSLDALLSTLASFVPELGGRGATGTR
ncbi:MAG TPA: response regulator [Anaeromyxobacteraceae bacterium]